MVKVKFVFDGGLVQRFCCVVGKHVTEVCWSRSRVVLTADTGHQGCQRSEPDNIVGQEPGGIALPLYWLAV